MSVAVGAHRTSTRVAPALAAAAPVVFLIVVLAGAATTLTSLIGTPSVDIFHFASVDHDGQALRLGQGLYHDPSSAAYTGLLYTPGMPFLISLLDRVHLWSGWSVVLTVGAALAFAAMVAGVARAAAPADLPLVRARAAGWGGIAIWLATATTGILYLGYSDVVAWSAALSGLVLAATGDRSRRRAAGAIALMTLGFWCKQTTIVVPIVLSAWMLARAWHAREPLRPVLAFLGALLAVNVAVLAVVNALTGGWEAYFNFLLPTNHARIYGPHRLARDVVEATGVALLAAGALLGVAELPRLRVPRRLGLGSLLAAFVVVGFASAMWFRSKQGGEQNQYIGVAFALAMLGALGWARAHARGRGLAADAIVAALLVLALGATAAHGTRLSFSRLHGRYDQSVPAGLRALAARHTIFHPVFSDLDRDSMHEVFPDATNVADLVAAGREPGMIVHALASRRFDLAVTYAAASDPNLFAIKERYMSAYGRRDAHYLWKLDQLIRAGYAPAPGFPRFVLARRSGPNRAQALAACFGTLHLAGAEWQPRAGGGLWCPDGQDALRLRAAPERLSQLVAQGPVGLRGRTLVVSGGRGTHVRLSAGGWVADVARRATGWTATAGGRPLRLAARGPRARIALAGAPANAPGAQIVAAATGRPSITLAR